VSVVTAYATAAIVGWMVIGALLNSWDLRRPALFLIAIYCLYYGLTEATGIHGLRPPGRNWQVPQTFVVGTSRRRRTLVWAAILGPGFFTRNPYAGFGLLPLGVAALDSVPTGVLAAAAIGFAHGTGRALGLLRDARDARDARGTDPSGYLKSVLRSMYWRKFDGIALLAVAVMAVFVFGRPW
jgi:hypothetical protein